jgi:hypothetical protein
VLIWSFPIRFWRWDVGFRWDRHRNDECYFCRNRNRYRFTMIGGQLVMWPVIDRRARHSNILDSWREIREPQAGRASGSSPLHNSFLWMDAVNQIMSPFKWLGRRRQMGSIATNRTQLWDFPSTYSCQPWHCRIYALLFQSRERAAESRTTWVLAFWYWLIGMVQIIFQRE